MLQNDESLIKYFTNNGLQDSEELIKIIKTLKEKITINSGLLPSLLINPPTNKQYAIKQYQDFLRRII